MTLSTGGGFIEILSCGPFVQMQDSGRLGHFSIGLTRGGAADEKAYNWANKLLGNAIGTPGLEISMGPFACMFSEEVRFAICGAEMRALLDSKRIPNGSTAFAKAGSKLELEGARFGLHSYLAVESGWLAESYLGSVCIPRTEQMAWNQNPDLRKGMRLHWAKSFGGGEKSLVRRVPWEYFGRYSGEVVLPYIPNFDRTMVRQETLNQFENELWSVGADFNRMGYRLQGKAIRGLSEQMRSHGICRGMIQVPPDGQPIVMLNDHQTMGGYPVLGCLTHAACNRLNQCKKGDRLRFFVQDIEHAQHKRLEFLRFFNRGF